MVLNDDATVERGRDLLWRIAPGYLVLGRLDGTVHEAAGAAPEIWTAIHGPITIDRLIASLAQQHAVEPEQIRDDVISFLADLVAAELITAHG